MASKKQQQTRLQIRRVAPQLPGPWQYLDLLPMLRLMQTRLNDLPRLAYPLIAYVIWRTAQGEQRKRAQARLGAQREAIRRGQQIWVVKPQRRRRFLVF